MNKHIYKEGDLVTIVAEKEDEFALGSYSATIKLQLNGHRFRIRDIIGLSGDEQASPDSDDLAYLIEDQYGRHSTYVWGDSMKPYRLGKKSIINYLIKKQ